ncbi:MAG TPA: T9SS type A sorting domain-containing protein [Candidatus Kapabacteria bacterium]|nr:T9SS type A sorting domain-containing protein [Candidatus Kapabacteria bacterium]
MTVTRIRLALFAAALLGSIALIPATAAKAQAITDTLNCGQRSRIDLGAVVTGGTLKDSLFLFSTDTSTNFKIVPLSSAGFSSTDTSAFLPLGQRRYATTIEFSQSTPGFDSVNLIIESRSFPCQDTFNVIAEAVGPDTDNAVIPLIHTSHDIIAFKSDTTETLHIQLLNNGPTITFDTLKLDSATAFRIDLSSITFPYTLDSGSFFPLKLSFIATNPGFYTDFISAPNHPIIPLSIQGLLQPKDAVQHEPPVTTYLRLYPNPSQGAVWVHAENITKAQATITDVLGRIEREASFRGDWQWDRETDGGGIAPAGTYFLVVTGTDANGKAVHEVERIVLE